MKRFLLSDAEFFQNVPAGGGIYRLHCFSDDKQHTVLPVSRVLGIDPEGVLYLGKATVFTDRVVNLKKSILPGFQGTSHICGRRYKLEIYKSFGEKFPVNRLCVSFEPTDTPEPDEKDALSTYTKRFGELPPLNRQG